MTSDDMPINSQRDRAPVTLCVEFRVAETEEVAVGPQPVTALEGVTEVLILCGYGLEESKAAAFLAVNALRNNRDRVLAGYKENENE